jgi:ubiquitin-conjugating enzyme (huntingtin interacting protein 2)
MHNNKRLIKELAEHKNNTDTTIKIETYNDKNINYLKCTITPNEDSIYHFVKDGVSASYNLDITISPEYPFVEPKVKFTPTIFHPNVYSVTGDICLDILKDAWTPALTIHTVCLSILSLMNAPNTSDPVNAVASNLYDTDKIKYKEEVISWYLSRK